MEEKEVVCVTGAGGYLASWVVKFLLGEGYKVHGTVRDPSDNKNSHLNKLENASENLQLFKADLLDNEALCVAITGCTGVFHVACPVPFTTEIANPEVEVLAPGITGTRNVMNACLKAKVKKVVVVSTIGAIALNPNWPKDKIMNEDSWSDLEFCEATKQWYCLAKTKAEKEAWECAARNDLNIVTVCPSIIIGPLLQPTMNASGSFLLTLLRDGSESARSGSHPFIDVRDTADSLLLAYKNPEAKGRYICSAHDIRIEDLVEKMKIMLPNYNYPKSFGEEFNFPKLSSEKLQNLGWKYKPLEETIIDAVKNYEERGDLVRT